MADFIPLKTNYTGSDATSIGEFAAGDSVPVANGGTGATTASAARTALGASGLTGDEIIAGTKTFSVSPTFTGGPNNTRSTVAATATTTPIWVSTTGAVQDWTGTPTITNFPAAPLAGASREVYPASGTIITNNSNIFVQGAANYTVASGDRLIVTAKTTTTFDVFISPKATLGGTGIVIATSLAATSGTTLDFTGLPSGIKKLNIMLNAVSTSGSSMVIAQVGSGSFTTTGYNSAGSSNGTTSALVTTGFALQLRQDSTNNSRGVITLYNFSGNTWIQSGTIGTFTSGGGYDTFALAGTGLISGVLDRVRITTVNGTDTFDAGAVNISYEF